MKEKKIRSIPERRERLQRVSEMLAEKADNSKFVSTYSRMNPAATHKLNSFLFGSPNQIARAIIFGPWLYIHAPQVKLPKGVVLLSEEEIKQRHLGRLTAKVLLTERDSIQIVENLIQAFEREIKMNRKKAERDSVN